MSGIYDVDSVPPHECKDYDIEELPIGAESDLTAEEKWDIIFHLSGQKKTIYLVYIHNLSTCSGDPKILQRITRQPDFTSERNEFIYNQFKKLPDNFVHSIAQEYRDVIKSCESLSYDDLVQEGWIGLLKAAKDFDESKGVTFPTFSYYRIEGYIKNLLRDEFKKQIAESKTENTSFTESIEQEAHIQQALEDLSEQEQRILELYASGYTQEEISGEVSFQISQQHVSRILDKIKANV